MSHQRSYLLAVFLIVSCIVCDRVTKHMASVSLKGTPPIELAGGIITLGYAENTGAMLSLGAGLSESARFWILTVGVGVLLAGILLLLLLGHDLSRPMEVGLSLMLGGGLSNFVDRLINDGRVVDFLTLGLGNLRTGVFNAADVAITGGVCIFFIASLLHRKKAHP